jgi:hypothetical protein
MDGSTNTVWFACSRCCEVFSEQVWCCPICRHHWLVGTVGECRNCHRTKEGRGLKAKRLNKSDEARFNSAMEKMRAGDSSELDSLLSKGV